MIAKESVGFNNRPESSLSSEAPSPSSVCCSFGVSAFYPSESVRKLLLVIPTLDRSGAEKQFMLLATGLPKDRFDVRVIALTRGGPYQADLEAAGIPVTVLHKRWKFDPVTLGRLRREITRWQPDIIHTWLFAANSYARLVTRPNERRKIVVSERCVDQWKAAWQLALDRRQIRRTSVLVGNSEPVAQFYRRVGYPPDRVAVISNAVIPPEPLSAEREQQLRTEWDLAPDARVIGAVGRLAPQKRPADIIWAFQLLRQLHEPVNLVLIGDGPLRGEMEALARKFGCDHLCRFVGHREDASEVMPLFDLYWLLSEFEGLSNSLMEAMACGVVPIVSDIPANVELVTDGRDGFTVNVGDCQAVAGFSDRLLADDDLWRSCSEAARNAIIEPFSLESMLEQHVELYDSLDDF